MLVALNDKDLSWVNIDDVFRQVAKQQKVCEKKQFML